MKFDSMRMSSLLIKRSGVRSPDIRTKESSVGFEDNLGGRSEHFGWYEVSPDGMLTRIDGG